MKTMERNKGQAETPGSKQTPAACQPGTKTLLFKSCKCPEKGNDIFISLCMNQLFLGFFCEGKMLLLAEQQEEALPESPRTLQKTLTQQINRKVDSNVLTLFFFKKKKKDVIMPAVHDTEESHTFSATVRKQKPSG